MSIGDNEFHQPTPGSRDSEPARLPLRWATIIAVGGAVGIAAGSVEGWIAGVTVFVGFATALNTIIR